MDSRSTIAVMEAMRELVRNGVVSDGSGADARTKGGSRTTYDSATAHRWSLGGATKRAYLDAHPGTGSVDVGAAITPVSRALDAAAMELDRAIPAADRVAPWGGAGGWAGLPGRTPQDVVALIDLAIRHLRGEHPPTDR